MELRTLQDWVVERRLRLVPGVSDVLVLGGKTKEFQAEVDLNRMRAYGLTLPQIISAIGSSNANVGGRTISLGEQSVNVRGIGVITSVKDIENIVLTQQGGLPVLLSDVAKVQIGFRPRLGISGRDDTTDVVSGIVLMQKFERTMEVVTRVREAVEKLNTDGTLPTGVRIVPFYDRGDLVGDHRSHRPAQHGVRHCADLPDPVAVPRQPALGASSSRPPSRSRCSSRSSSRCCAANRPTCCRSARSIWASSSMRPSSWWRTSSAISPITRAGRSPIRQAASARSSTAC